MSKKVCIGCCHKRMSKLHDLTTARYTLISAQAREYN